MNNFSYVKFTNALIIYNSKVNLHSIVVKHLTISYQKKKNISVKKAFCFNLISFLPDNVWMVEFFKLFEERNFPQDGHGDPVLRQGEPHGLQGDDGPRQPVPGLEHGAVGS